MYDAFSQDYDRFVNWPNRLNFELPFIERALQGTGARRVLDAAAGTGMHAIALAQRGYQVAGADLSAGMIARARQNVAQAGVETDLRVAGFGGLAAAFGDQPPFDAILCLGNSLPHILTGADLHAALFDFRACLRPGGLLLVQSRNFDAVLAGRQRWMEPQSHHEGEREWLFVRFYDFRPDGLIDFNILTLTRADGSGWQQQVNTTGLAPQLQAMLTGALAAAGFEQIDSFGGLDGAPFDPSASGNLVLQAIARSA
jgi:glycine/sarcosine N-methyltransferase